MMGGGQHWAELVAGLQREIGLVRRQLTWQCSTCNLQHPCTRLHAVECRSPFTSTLLSRTGQVVNMDRGLTAAQRAEAAAFTALLEARLQVRRLRRVHGCGRFMLCRGCSTAGCPRASCL